MGKFNSILVWPLGAAFFLQGCATGFGSDHELENEVQQNAAQIKQMQPVQTDTWNQLQAMREEINSLKGQIDDLNNAGGSRALVDRLNRHDAALRQVESNMAMDLNLGQPGQQTAQQPGAQVSTQTALAPAPVAMNGQAAQPAATGSYGLEPEPRPAQAAYQPAQPPSGETWGMADPKPQVVVPKKDISLALFDAGVNDFNARRYAQAEKSFTDFLNNYKDHTQAAEAQFYLAECYFHRNQYADAALAYDTVIKKYPKSSSAPGAYLKQGISFSKLKQKDAAKARLQELINKFPKSPEAARAKSFLKTNA